MMILRNRPELLVSVPEAPATVLSWRHVERAADELTAHLSPLQADALLVMVRGGMVLGALLAHRLHIRTVHFFQAVRTASNAPHDYCDIAVVRRPDLRRHERLIIVEDIVFKGATTHAAIEAASAQHARVCAVSALVMDGDYQQSPNGGVPLFAGYQCLADEWIRFPWERPVAGEREPRA